MSLISAIRSYLRKRNEAARCLSKDDLDQLHILEYIAMNTPQGLTEGDIRLLVGYGERGIEILNFYKKHRLAGKTNV